MKRKTGVFSARRTFNFGSFLLFFCLFYPSDVLPIDVKPIGMTRFAGVPVGIIRDIEVIGDTTFIAAENGVFSLIGGHSEQVVYRDNNLLDGTVSDLFFDSNEALWLVEFGVGIFSMSLNTGVTKQHYEDAKWPKYAWKVVVVGEYLVVSLIEGVLVVDKLTGEIQSWASEIGVNKVSKVFTGAKTKDGVVVLSSPEALLVVDTVSKSTSKLAIREHFPLLDDLNAVEYIEEHIYLGGNEGIYKWGKEQNSKVFFPFEKNLNVTTPVAHMYKSNRGRFFVAAGGLYELEDGILKKPKFMAPFLSSNNIKSIVKISEVASGEVLLASSQLGLISLGATHEAVNFLNENSSTNRESIRNFGFTEEFGQLVQTDNATYSVNLDNGLLKKLEWNDNKHCIEDNLRAARNILNSRVLQFDYCSLRFSHTIPVSEGSFYAYYDDGKEAAYVLFKDGESVDDIIAPREMVHSLISASGEIVGFDSNNNVHIQLSKYNWKKISPNQGGWSGVTCLLEMDDLFIVCTSGQGIKTISKKNGEIASADFFQDTVIRFIRGALISSTGNLWLLSNMGLFVLTDSNDLYAINETDGIVDTDFEYQGIFEARGKILIFGDKYSYVVDESKMIFALNKKKHRKSKVVFSSVSWKDEEGNKSTNLFSSSEKIGTLVLDNSFSELRVEFRTNSFTNYSSEKLEFRILGIDEDWKTHPKSEAFLSISDIGFGDYEIQARVKGADNPLSAFQFRVRRPLYWSERALVFYIILLLGLTLAFYLNFFQPYWKKFQSTALYRNITRYEITDGQSKFEKMLRSKERYISNIAHELRTPMQVIKGCLEKLSDDKNQSSKEFISITNNMMRVEKLLKQLRDETPQAIEAADYYKLYTVGDIKFIVNALEPLARQKRQTIDFKVNGKKRISLISDSLEKILSNLISNAVKYTPERGNIRIVCSLDSKILKIVVQDDGDGIDKELQEKIFERFTRGNTLQDGDGIGLATVRNLVELNQGNISLESKKGVGSKFTIILPVDDIDFVNSRATKMPLSPFDSREKTILIVDGNREFRTYLFDLLSENFRCLVAKNGRQALEVLQHYLVDLVLTDQFMQEMDGISLAHSMRNSQRLSAIPILMLAATTGNELEKRALEAKIDYFISKPAASEEIIMRIEHLIFMRGKSLKEEGEQTTIFEYGCLSIPEFLNEKDVAFYLNFLAVLEKNYQDETFNREQAASQLMMSARSLNRRMSELFDYNFNEFLSRFRIEKSIPLLMKGSTTLDAGLDVGYGTGAYFSTSFKKFMGLPPKKFIEQYKAPEHSS